jgi:hypothetical protein
MLGPPGAVSIIQHHTKGDERHDHHQRERMHQALQQISVHELASIYLNQI